MNHTRIIDLGWPEEGGVQGGSGEQTSILDAPDYGGAPGGLGPDDVSQIPVLTGGVS